MRPMSLVVGAFEVSSSTLGIRWESLIFVSNTYVCVFNSIYVTIVVGCGRGQRLPRLWYKRSS